MSQQAAPNAPAATPGCRPLCAVANCGRTAYVIGRGGKLLCPLDADRRERCVACGRPGVEKRA